MKDIGWIAVDEIAVKIGSTTGIWLLWYGVFQTQDYSPS
jgi:hypothetical protein